MANRPFLIFPRPAVVGKQRRGGGGGKLVKPTAAQQRARLDAKFRQIAQSLQQVQTTVQGIEPEQVVVFETIGESLHDLVHARGLQRGVAAPEFRGLRAHADRGVDVDLRELVSDLRILHRQSPRMVFSKRPTAAPCRDASEGRARTEPPLNQPASRTCGKDLSSRGDDGHLAARNLARRTPR